MTATEWSLLGAVFLGGALPWLEAVIVIPAGILANLPVIPVVLVAVLGNLLTVGLTAFYGRRLVTWWTARRRRRREAAGKGQDHATLQRRQRRQERIDRIMARWGMPGLAFLGPLGLGTQLSALAGVAAGVSAWASFLWISAGTIAWSVAAAALTVGGVSFLGVGA